MSSKPELHGIPAHELNATFTYSVTGVKPLHPEHEYHYALNHVPESRDIERTPWNRAIRNVRTVPHAPSVRNTTTRPRSRRETPSPFGEHRVDFTERHR